LVLLTSPPVPLSTLERGNRGQGVKGVRLREPTALVVGYRNKEFIALLNKSLFKQFHIMEEKKKSSNWVVFAVLGGAILLMILIKILFF